MDASICGTRVFCAIISIITRILRSIANNLVLCILLALVDSVARNVLALVLAFSQSDASWKVLESTDSTFCITERNLAVFRIDLVLNSPCCAIFVNITNRRNFVTWLVDAHALWNVLSLVNTLSCFSVAESNGALVSVFAFSVLADTLCFSIVSDLAINFLAKSCLEVLANVTNVLVALCDSLHFASLLCALCNCAFLGSCALAVIWNELAKSSLWIARVLCASNLVVTNLWCVDTSNVCNALVFSAFVVVIASLWNIDTTEFWMAEIKGALVVVIASSLLVPALWKLAVCMFANQAVIVSIALLPVLVFTEVVALSSDALSDLVLEALSNCLSTTVL
jgi:hypothetical protein